MTWTRRQLLASGAAAFGLSALGRSVPSLGATASQARHKLVVLFAQGGWDTQRFSVDPTTIPSDVVPEGTTMAQAHGLSFVDHPARAAVRTFFERYGDLTAMVDGLLVRSVNHLVCERLLLTGASRQGTPDWPSVLGAEAAGQHALPNLVLSGPSAPGDLHRYASIVGGSQQLQDLLERTVFQLGDQPVAAPATEHLDRVDAALAERVARRLGEATDPGLRRMLDTMDDGLARVDRLRADATQVEFSGRGLTQQVRTATSMLAEGVARCVTVAQGGFDTHADNDDQDGKLHDLFAAATLLIERLAHTPSPEGGGVLLDDTTVLIASEMGRTPYLNIRGGKDHWPYTTALLVGGRIAGGQRIGGHDSYLNALPTDLVSGLPDDDGVVMVPQHLGATLMALSGIDPETWVPGYAPIEAAIRT